MKQADHTEAISQQGHYAGAVSRLVAFVIDQTVATAVFSITVAVSVSVVALVTRHDLELTITGWFALLLYGIWLFIYYAYPWSMSGKSLGMAVLGIRVVTTEGAPIGARAAAIRTIALPLSFLTLGIGFIPIVAGRERRAMHDRIAGTAVVYAWDARAARWRFLAKESTG